MSLFLSTYINKIDKKGRVSFPASFRNTLIIAKDQPDHYQQIVLFRSNNHKALEGFSMDRMDGLSDRLDHFDMFSDAHDDMATAIFAESVPLSIDGDGRIIIPQELIDYAGFDGQVAFVGLGQKFQLWSPATLKTRKEEARKNISSKGLTLPKAIHNKNEA